MDFSEFEFNLTDGELVETGVVLIHGENQYTVSAMVSKKYARKEVDGRYTTDLPTFTPSVVIAKSQIPDSISEEDYRYLLVVLDGVTYAVRFVTGTGFVTLTLKPVTETAPETEGEIV